MDEVIFKFLCGSKLHIFNYEKFLERVDKEFISYSKASPYPFAYFDDLFDDDLLDEVNNDIDQVNFEKDIRSITGVEVKTRSNFEDNESFLFL